jgi:hypothetical protein
VKSTDDTTRVRLPRWNPSAVRLLGALSYLGAVALVFLYAEDWGQLLLVLLCLSAGATSGRWWSVALAALVLPAAAITELFSDDDYGGDSVSGPAGVALFVGLFFMVPMAVVIGIGVGLRRFVRRRNLGRHAPVDRGDPGRAT